MDEAQEVLAIAQSALQAGTVVTRVVVDSGIYLLRLVGPAAPAIVKALQDRNFAGSSSLRKMVTSGATTYFDVPEEKVKDFTKEAKKSGIMYHVISREGDNGEKIYTYLVHQEDAAKLNRIAEKLGITAVKIASREEPAEERKETSQVKPQGISDERKILEDMMAENPLELDDVQRNPKDGLQMEEGPSGSPSGISHREKKSSVRENIKQLTAETGKKPESNARKTMKELMADGMEAVEDLTVNMFEKQI